MQHIKSCLSPDSTVILHPIFIGVYPAFSLAASNISQMPLYGAFRSGFILLALSACLFFLMRLFVHNPHQSALLASFLILIYFSYGNLVILFVMKGWLQSSLGRPDILFVTLIGIAILGFWAIFRFKKASASLTKIFNFTSLIILFFPSFHIAGFLLQNQEVHPVTNPFAVIQPAHFRNEDLPDIYYIILDGYARADVLRDIYDYDNSEFIDFLKDEGFYVAENSHSNYMQTALSVSSSFNTEYLDFIPKQLGSEAQTRYPLIHLIETSGVRKFLTANGYQTTAFQTGYDPTNLYDAQHFIKSEEVNNFEELLLNVSFGSVFIPTVSQDTRRASIQNIFHQLQAVPNSDTPSFVFAHIVSPHPPFLFGPNGEPRDIGSWYQDGSYYPGGPEEYVEKYRDQLHYISQLTEQTIHAILSKPGKKPIIILQSDHGPGAYLDWDSADRSCIRERLSILNAYYFPGRDTSLLYDSITPVNSFRVVFDTYFRTQLDLVEDKSYYSGWNSPYRFLDVSDRLDDCPVLRNGVLAN